MTLPSKITVLAASLAAGGIALPLALSQPALGPPRCHGTKEARHPHSKWLFALAHGVVRPGYELDHVTSLCLGGSDTWANLQLQTWPEAIRKDRDKWRLCEAVCSGEMSQQEAVAELKPLA